jgi:hypothetical protein
MCVCVCVRTKVLCVRAHKRVYCTQAIHERLAEVFVPSLSFLRGIHFDQHTSEFLRDKQFFKKKLSVIVNAHTNTHTHTHTSCR